MPTLKDAHDFDAMTLFCKKCGQAMLHVGKTNCAGGGNVAGITHILAREKLFGIIGKGNLS